MNTRDHCTRVKVPAVPVSSSPLEALPSSLSAITPGLSLQSDRKYKHQDYQKTKTYPVSGLAENANESGLLVISNCSCVKQLIIDIQQMMSKC